MEIEPNASQRKSQLAITEQEKPDTQTDDQTEPKEPKEPEKKIHQTHFSVSENPLRNNGYDNGYEWIDYGNGHWKRVPKKTSGLQ